MPITVRLQRELGLVVLEGEAKLAFVATTDLMFGFARMDQSLRQGSPVRIEIFRDRAGAERWLGLPEGYEAKLVDATTP